MPNDKAFDDESAYGPVPDEVRIPARHRDPPPVLRRPLPSTPIADLRPAGQDPRLLNRSTEEPSRATGKENKALRKYPPAASGAERREARSFEETAQEIDEEEKNRPFWTDGYAKPAARPRQGFGLQLRTKYRDINGIFSPAEWYDDRRFVESAESRGLTPPIGPWIVQKRKPKQLFREQGEAVRRPEPPPLRRPADHVIVKKIQFKRMSLLDIKMGSPAKPANPELADAIIEEIAESIRQNPKATIEIRASVGLENWVSQLLVTTENIRYVMEKRAEAVIKRLEDRGIDRSRMRIGYGKIGAGNDDRNVEFAFDPPSPEP